MSQPALNEQLDNLTAKIAKQAITPGHDNHFNAIDWTRDLTDPADLAFYGFMKTKLPFEDAEPTVGPLSINWNLLLAYINDYSKIFDNIRLNRSDLTSYVDNDFKIGNVTIKAGNFTEDTANELVKGLSLMFKCTGQMDKFKFYKLFKPVNSYDPTAELYERIYSKGNNTPHIVEDFVTGYIGLEPNTPAHTLATHNIVRMVKQAKRLTDTASMKNYTQIDQAYFLTGGQGTGKTTFLRSLFLGHYSQHNQTDGFKNRYYPQLRASNPIYINDEFSSLNTRKATAEFKAQISVVDIDADIKYNPALVKFRNRSVFVATTNETDFLTDTTSGGDNRRFLFIPFRDDESAILSQKRVEDFYKGLNLPFTKDVNNHDTDTYDTEQYYLDMQHSILYSDEYKAIKINIGTDDAVNAINQNVSRETQTVSDLKETLRGVVNGYIVLTKAYDRMLSSEHKQAFNTLDTVTDLMNHNFSVNEVFERVGVDPETSKVVAIEDLPFIYSSDINEYIKKADIGHYRLKDVQSTFGVFGYVYQNEKSAIYKKRG